MPRAQDVQRIMKRFIPFILILPSLVFPWSYWKTIKTPNFTVIYKPGYDSSAYTALKTLEYYRPYVQKLTGNYRHYNTPIIIEDIGTVSNGITNPVFPSIRLFTYPPSVGVFGLSQNWWADVGTHEYTHMLHLSNSSGWPQSLVSFYGTIFNPNICSPGWITEGITVYSESNLPAGQTGVSKYSGRLNDGFFDAYIGANVMDKKFPSVIKATYSPTEFPSEQGIYLYGGEFFNYLAKTYGEDKFAKFFNSYGSSILSYLSPLFPEFGMDLTAKRIYKKSFWLLWDEWKEYENERFKNFAIEGEQITHHGWDIKSPIISNDKLYYQRSYTVKTGALKTFSFNRIVERNLADNKEKTIVSTTSFFTMPLRIHKNKLFYAVAEIKLGYPNSYYYTYGFYSVIHEKNFSTGKCKTILADKIRAFDVLPDNDIIYSKDKKDSFGSNIYVYKKKSKTKTLLFSTDYLVDEILSIDKYASSDSCCDANVIVSAKKDWQNFNLYTLNLKTGEFTPLVETPCAEGAMSVYKDKLFFASNLGKTYSVYCYDFSLNKTCRLTHNRFASAPAYDEKTSSLYFVGLNSNGFDIYRKTIDFSDTTGLPVNTDSNLVFLPCIDSSLANIKISHGNYFDNLKTLIPALHFPLLFSDTDSAFIGGVILAGSDAVGDFSYITSTYFNFSTNKIDYSVNLSNSFFAPLQSYIIATNIGDKILSLGAQYPLINKLSPGFSQLYLGVAGNLYDDLLRKEINPYFTAGCKSPTMRNTLNISVPIERKTMDSDIDRTAVYGTLNILQYLPNSQLSLNTNVIYDPDNPESVAKRIRGYENAIATKKELILKLDYSFPVLKIRNGIWNPNLFLEDLCLGIFGDACLPIGTGAMSDNSEPQLSTGLELHLETKILFIAPLDVGVRFSVNRDNKTFITPIFSSALAL